MKYNAFISYRHAPLDMEIAKKVHTGLETYKIPASVKKRLGIKKINRVFRDQEELPIGSNLSDNIGEALRESDHLIVICSPRTPESEWVGKEIDAFIKDGFLVKEGNRLIATYLGMMVLDQIILKLM